MNKEDLGVYDSLSDALKAVNVGDLNEWEKRTLHGVMQSTPGNPFDFKDQNIADLFDLDANER